MIDWQSRFGLLALGLAGSLALSGCGGAGNESEDVASEQGALVISTCTGAAISAAITAGGSVILNCGTSPISIQVPSTTVAHSTQLRSAQPGTVTFTHLGPLFDVTSGATFSMDGISLNGAGLASMGIHADQPTSVQSVLVSNATISNYSGFAIDVGALSSLSVSNTTFQGNNGQSFGVAIYAEGANTTITNSTFFGNHSTGSGGVIRALNGVLNVSGCTFKGNSADLGGAIYATAQVTITNSSFGFNTASFGGGAILANGRTAKIYNSTFHTNTSPAGTLGGSFQVFGSIIYDATASSAPCALAGSSNIQWPAVTPLCGPGFRFADPKLGALTNNGGPTQTFALQAGSAAIDSSTSACPTTDQRGVLRPRDGDGNGSFVCDVGAYER